MYQLPSNIWLALTDLFYPNGMFRSALRDITKKSAYKGRSDDEKSATPGDLSVAEAYSKFVMGGGTELIDNMASALIHGVWGGDAYRISAKKFDPIRAKNTPLNWNEPPTEGVEPNPDELKPAEITRLDVEAQWQDGADIPLPPPGSPATYTTHMDALPRRLEAILRLMPNVEIRTDTAVTGMQRIQQAEYPAPLISIAAKHTPSSSTSSDTYNHCISTLPPSAYSSMNDMLRAALSITPSNPIPSSTIQVVNLLLPRPPALTNLTSHPH